MRAKGELAVELPPSLFPFILPEHPDWRPRYATYGRPGEYHNGGIWPFISGFYVAAVVAAGRQRLAERKLAALTELVRPAVNRELRFGFNEWFKAQDGRPRGQDWQTWSAAMYLYAATCVEQGRTPFFDRVRTWPAKEPLARRPGG
jgi:glycogen debranching enzyme